MNEYPNLSKEELEALLGNDPQAEDYATAITGMQGITTEETLHRLGAGLRALTAKVIYLEETVKELRLQLLQQERSASNVRESTDQNLEQAVREGDSRDEQAQRVPAHSDTKLSRLERFGRRGR
jgi:hypothetical protein